MALHKLVVVRRQEGDLRGTRLHSEGQRAWSQTFSLLIFRWKVLRIKFKFEVSVWTLSKPLFQLSINNSSINSIAGFLPPSSLSYFLFLHSFLLFFFHSFFPIWAHIGHFPNLSVIVKLYCYRYIESGQVYLERKAVRWLVPNATEESQTPYLPRGCGKFRASSSKARLSWCTPRQTGQIISLALRSSLRVCALETFWPNKVHH